MKSFLEQIVENFQALDEKEKRWQDNDGDGIWYEPGDDVKAEAKGKYDDGDGKDEKCDYVPCNGEELDEMSTTAGVAPVPTKYSFSKKEKKEMKYPGVAEAMDRKYEQLIEGYRDFALGKPNSNPKQTVNGAIREVAKKLKEIEETVKYTGRLKTESGIAHSGFSSGTHNALRKISERLIKISERVRSLGE